MSPDGGRQRTCPCGGGCPRCGSGKDVAGSLLARPADGEVTGDRYAPAIIGEVLKSTGRRLDSDSLSFFEPRFARRFDHVRVHTDAKASESAKTLGAAAYTAGHDIVFRAGRFSPQTEPGRRLIAHELAHVAQQGRRPSAPGIRRKVDFEFDLNYGTEKSAPATSSEANDAQSWDESPITKHEKKDASGAVKDGFEVVQDGNRIEINTMRFGVGTSGEKKLDDTMNNVMAFVDELKTKCQAAKRVKVAKPADSVASMPLGKPRFFTAGFSSDPARVYFPLGMKTYFRSSCGVSSAPQATMDVPLESIDPLVSEIKASKGKKPGVALTGPDKRRQGVRSKGLFRAQTRVKKSRKAHIDGGTTLADGTPVTSANFSERLVGFMIMVVSYLLTSEIIDRRDKEAFAKAYPPIVTHTRFRDMFHRILSDAERKVFIELYGSPAARNNLYALAGRSSGGGSRDLFPPQATIQDREFAVRPTWDDLINKTLADDKLMDVHGDESMFTPLAGATSGPTRAGKKRPTIWSRIGLGSRKRRRIGARLELRRIGFSWVPSGRWRTMVKSLFQMARRLNNVP